MSGLPGEFSKSLRRAESVPNNLDPPLGCVREAAQMAASSRNERSSVVLCSVSTVSFPICRRRSHCRRRFFVVVNRFVFDR